MNFEIKIKIFQENSFFKFYLIISIISHENTHFYNFVFVDESTIRLNDYPRYHLRLPSKIPIGIVGGDKYFYKLNIFV